ncbi:MAG: hypothetical protein OZSIB_3982 [Candidatus Ozemobacter sibiricus]|uniref:Uncharacterized protein n=1 Tax=Candidatus Ozemobacter sibiricus TaxID=2268124 RepID=A0A367ZNX9_9BACT|nr:MAG: hypothetical protein OZSIB_3982 [Candidatus Ozemobacter sibiricus]
MGLQESSDLFSAKAEFVCASPAEEPGEVTEEPLRFLIG